jgi:XTP/dITP diphosphohydrolase
VIIEPGSKLVVASHNAGKVREFGDLLRPFKLDVVAAAELRVPEPEETGLTFVENSLLKSRSCAEASGLLSLADDSGLAVEALGGEPGIYSARWAGPGKDFKVAMEKVETALQACGAIEAKDRRAAFICVLSLAWPNGEQKVFEGKVEGTLVWPPRGTQGFGYDPVFQADGYDITFGEMAPHDKHAISHRADAFNKMLEHFTIRAE